jgi:hypothetical protein
MRRIASGALLGLIVGGTAVGRAQEAAPPAPPTPALSETLRRDGPPTRRPAEDPGPPPADGVFFVPGEYVPQGDTSAWRDGFWAKTQPGWAWLPARWTRQAEGWSFDEGRWIRTRDPAVARSRSRADGDAAAGPLASGYVPMSAYAGGSPAYGWGNPYFAGGGFGLYSPPMMWLSGTGFGGYGPVMQHFSPGFGMMYPFGMGWGLGPWGGWGGGWGWW